MYICEQCGKQTKAGEKQIKKVVVKRPVKYPCGSIGWEIIREVNVCCVCK